MQQPGPEQYNPPLTWRAHLWRTALALLISTGVWLSVAQVQSEAAAWVVPLDLGLGLVAFVLSFLRRRFPFTVAMLSGCIGAFSASSAGFTTLTAVSLATRRVVWQIVLVGAVSVAAAQTYWAVMPQPESGPWWVNFSVGLAFTIAMLVWGMYLGSRRELLWTLRDRAERAEEEQERRVEQGRSTERARIAREMHDVLAHRISLITMHAGALAYRTDLSAEEMRETAGLIQAKSHEALSDLRQVLGVLRGDETPGGQDRPQPTYDDLHELVREAEESGMRVEYVAEVDDATAMPEQVGRTTYRIVQEGLTNARKHAPGVKVLVRVAGSPASGVEVSVRNLARSLQPVNGVAPPGSGLGLVGLGERAKLAGGRLETRQEAGIFELRGWLPWTA